MPYFKVSHNGKLRANAGLSSIDVLTAHVIVGASGPASVAVHGMRTTKKRQEHLEWVSDVLRPGDRVSIAYVATGRASKPLSKSIFEAPDPDNIEKELERLQAEIARFESRASAEPEPPPPAWTRAPRPRRLRVSIGRKPPIDADLGEEEYLQAVLNLTARGCVFEVDAMTVLEDGSTKGKRWLQRELRPGQQITITYVT